MRVEWEKGLEVDDLFLLGLNVYGFAGYVVQEGGNGCEQRHEGPINGTG